MRTEADLVEEQATAEPGDVHVHTEDGGKWAEGGYVHTMLCGAQCVIWDDDVVIEPKGFDFYLFEHGANASCKACLAALRGKAS